MGVLSGVNEDVRGMTCKSSVSLHQLRRAKVQSMINVFVTLLLGIHSTTSAKQL